MLLSRLFDRLGSLSSPEFSISREASRIEIHFAKSTGDFLIKRVLLAPDLSFSTILEAKQQNANLILTPDSLFTGEMKSLEYHQTEIWRILLNQRICCIHLGSEWYNSNNGYSIALLNQLGLDPVDLFTVLDPASNQQIPVGRVASFKHPFQGNFVDFLKNYVPAAGISFKQTAKDPISQIAVVPIDQISSTLIYQVVDFGCDAIIGGGFSPNAMQAVKAAGICSCALSQATIFEIGLKYLTKLLSVEYPNDEFSYFSSPS
ncbi:MAG: hypothetical protein RBG13Loki_2764 [Promethearchaeota archaeon CR_4]|nr:MAG: hypothetical protein RBG13Loki_2764 [Candidatus Lokiarchaeota archaeon CR_4]